MREATWQGAMAYWPWGSGLGSYRWVFPAFHPPELGRYLVDLAHNDYLQLLMELGVWFVAIAGLAVALVAQRALALLRASRNRRGGWREADRLAVACGLGALATALHALVDYPFHIPANAMFAAFLLGVFLREPGEETGG
jgi:O-antigen ligase